MVCYMYDFKKKWLFCKKIKKEYILNSAYETQKLR